MSHRDEQCKTCGYGLTPLWMADGFRIVDDVRLAGRPTATHAEYLIAKQRILDARGHVPSDGYRAHQGEIAGTATRHYGTVPVPLLDLPGASTVTARSVRPSKVQP